MKRGLCIAAVAGVIAMTPLMARAQYYNQYSRPYVQPAPAYQPPVYINRLPGGGSMITQPGAQPYQPPVYTMPLPGGGAMITQPGAQPYQRPMFVHPLPGGGAFINQ